MKALSSLLRNKLKHPFFKGVFLHTKLQKNVEDFFKKKQLPVLFKEYDEKKQLLTLTAKHPSLANEALFLREELQTVLKRKGLPSVRSIKVGSF